MISFKHMLLSVLLLGCVVEANAILPVPPVVAPANSFFGRACDAFSASVKWAYNTSSRLTSGSKILSALASAGFGVITYHRLIAMFNILRDLRGDLYATNWLAAVIGGAEILWVVGTTSLTGAASVGAASNVLS